MSLKALGLLLMLSLMLPAKTTMAQETPMFRKCMDAVDLGALKMSQWTDCYEAELKRQDQKLNAAYRRTQKAASNEMRAALLKGQRAWIAYRDTWCSLEALGPAAPGGELNRLACQTDLTISQTKRLNEIF